MIAPAMQDSDTEFGYDFSSDEEELLLELASNSRAVPHHGVSLPPPSAQEVVQDGLSEIAVDGGVHLQSSVNAAHGIKGAATDDDGVIPIIQESRSHTIPPTGLLDQEVTYPNLSEALRNLDKKDPIPLEMISDDDEFDPYDDGRSPLQRFRSFPRKPLTVSDLTSGAWCELQYWYTLTRLPGGRRTRTPAMQQGTKIHQKLEDEVHTTVKIDILTKEDGFGLRLWNLVQGLRTLRDTGLTRELEVWGMIDGNLVNGVIDGVSCENPNPEFEEELSTLSSQPGSQQAALTDYFPPKKHDATNQNNLKYYLTDTKTRGTLAPITAVAFRPAKYQLLLYHRFLSDMAAGKLDYYKVFRRYGLDADERFSDSFMSQIGELHDEIFFDTPSSFGEQIDSSTLEVKTEGDEDATQDGSNTTILESFSSSGTPDLLNYGSLRELLFLVRNEIKLTFPLGAASLGHILTVQYIYREDGRELDSLNFPVSQQTLNDYLAKYMKWWRGERKAFGVDMEDAFKCRNCEFASDCSWRRSMDAKQVRKANERVQARRAVDRV
ncbi:Exonuclease V-like protein [Cladobotryum mycophilum]|uniref:Exonuclease V-like protein n=1 Tax=Cladobotryum mycophilum TaxID=491253 RepID=A0ABR0S7L1_9HYPO